MNKAILTGNLSADPKTTVTSNGITKCTFRLATQQKYVNQQTGQREADFHNIVVWRQLADLCAKYLTKGSKCTVIGAIQYRSYDAQDGTKRYVTEIVADEVEFLSTRSEHQNNDAQEQSYMQQERQGMCEETNGGFTEVETDELPF